MPLQPVGGLETPSEHRAGGEGSSTGCLAFAVLGSGSSGNSTLVRLDAETERHRRAILIDCGFSPLETSARLLPLGASLHDVTDILLTHLDRDHCHRGWSKPIVTHGITVHLHRRHLRAALRAGLPITHIQVFEAPFTLGPRTTVVGTLLAHDRLGSIGYRIEHEGARLGFATDLGRVPETLYETFTDLHALALESNYEPRLEIDSGRPPFLKRRVMGGLGHLSNDQALRAIMRIARVSTLSRITLLHLSRECNDPKLVRDLYARRAPGLARRLSISTQDSPTRLWTVEVPAVQLKLFGA